MMMSCAEYNDALLPPQPSAKPIGPKKIRIAPAHPIRYLLYRSFPFDRESPMPVLPLLKNPASYRPDTWLLDRPGGGLQWWTTSAAQVIESQLAQCPPSCDDQQHRLEDFRADFAQLLEEIARSCPSTGVESYQLDQRVFTLFRRHGFHDPYHELKHRENEIATALYPQRVAELDALSPDHLPQALIEGVMAGNRFDMACIAGIDDYHANGADFHATIDQLNPRPWLVDHLDAWSHHFTQCCAHPVEVLFFIDNAGADFVLGCLPLARALAGAGCEVVLAANSLPCANDITVAEATAVVEKLAQNDPVLAAALRANRLRLIGSGSGSLLIDLSDVAPACARAATDAQLLILEGMGRSIESNHNATFTCPTLKIGLLKDAYIAGRFEPAGEIFDIVCRFDP